MNNRATNYDGLDFRVIFPVLPLIFLAVLTIIFVPNMLQDGVRRYSEIRSIVFKIVLAEIGIYTVLGYIIFKIKKSRPVNI